MNEIGEIRSDWALNDAGRIPASIFSFSLCFGKQCQNPPGSLKLDAGSQGESIWAQSERIWPISFNFFIFFWKVQKKVAQKWNIFQLFPNAPAPRHPETLPPSKSSRWRCRGTNFHPDWTKWRPSYAHLKFQILTFFINIRSLPPLPRKIHRRKNGKHHLPPVFVLNHLYPIFPTVLILY